MTVASPWITQTGSAPEVQSGATATGNDEAAGVQPAASVEQIRTYLQVRRDSSMHTVTTATASSPTPVDRRHTIETFQTLVAEHGLQIEEWDTSTLDEGLRHKFRAFYAETAERKVIVVPTGQDPAERLHAVRLLLPHMGVTA